MRCRYCDQLLTDDGGVLVDETGGDVCGVRSAGTIGENLPHEPGVELIDIEPNAGTYTCTKFTLVYQDPTYTVEEWFTDNSSGVEVYDESGACVNRSAPDAVTEWEPSDDMRVTHYWGRYQGEVVPLMSKIAKEVLSD